MIVVIQCAGTKRPDAGYLRTSQGLPVSFVANPDKAPPSDGNLFARPDGLAEDGRSWREHLADYNSHGNNTWGLSTAFELYAPPAAPEVYRELVAALGRENVFILSAGWGLIGAGFLTPCYDITFAPEARKKAPWKHRHRDDTYEDFCHLVDPSDQEICFVGSTGYVPLFCQLTEHMDVPRTVYHYSKKAPRAPGCELRRFDSHKPRTWHYDCVMAVVAGQLG